MNTPRMRNLLSGHLVESEKQALHLRVGEERRLQASARLMAPSVLSLLIHFAAVSDLTGTIPADPSLITQHGTTR